MSDPLVIADPDEALIDVASRMCEEGEQHTAGVESGGLVGVASARDALGAFVEYPYSDA